MTKTEVAALLAAMYVYERRSEPVTKLEVESWHRMLTDVDLPEAQTVVSQHFLESDRPLSIAKLRAGVAELRKPPPPPDGVDDRTRIPDADPDDPKAFIEAMKARRWRPDPKPEEIAEGRLEIGGLGRKVPTVTREEVQDSSPRPRRWWLHWGKPSEASEETA